MGKICAFFGHREARLSNTEIQKLKETIRDLVCNYDVDTFWSGGYSNFDSDAVNIVEELKKRFSSSCCRPHYPIYAKSQPKKNILII